MKPPTEKEINTLSRKRRLYTWYFPIRDAGTQFEADLIARMRVRQKQINKGVKASDRMCMCLSGSITQDCEYCGYKPGLRILQ